MLALCATLVSGCAGLGMETGGEVSISRPQVFTRERLLTERLREVNWIQQQRNRPFEAGTLQGIRDVRTARAIVAELTAAVDIAARRQGAVANQVADANRARQEEINALNHQIALAKLRKQLEDLDGGLTKVDPSTAAPPGPGDNLAAVQAALNDIKTKLTELTTRQVSSARATSAQLFNQDAQTNRLVDPSTSRAADGLQITRADAFRDEAAYRNDLNAEERKRALDDVHDLDGSVLYEMRLDIAIAPGRNTRRDAVVELRLEGSEPAFSEFAKSQEPLYDQLNTLFSEEANALVQRLQDRAASRNLSEAWMQRIAAGLSVKEREKLEIDCLKTLRENWPDFVLETYPSTPPDTETLQQLASGLMRLKQEEADLKTRSFQKSVRQKLVSTSRFSDTSAGSTAGAGKAWQEENVAKQEIERQVKAAIADRNDCLIAGYVKQRIEKSDLGRGYKVALSRNSAPRFDQSSSPNTNGSNPLNADAKTTQPTQQMLRPALDPYRPSRSLRIISQQVTNTGAPRLDIHAGERWILGNLAKKGADSIWVASAEPAEYTQNISDVTSLNLISDIALAASTSDPGRTLQGTFSRFKQTQEIGQAIKRRPLVTSFIRGKDRFGWIIGPKFDLSNGKTEFRHVPAHYTVTASVVVPGWARSFTVRACGYWIESDGSRSKPFNPISGAAADGCDGSDAKPTDANTFEVQVPGTQRSILLAIAKSQLRDLLSSPEIFLLPNTETARNDGDVARDKLMVLRATTPAECPAPVEDPQRKLFCEQRLVIEGRELWRNPEVFVGNQRANRVELLPSMQGLVAYFDHVRMPNVENGQPPLVDLVVSTSAGNDRLQDAVMILPPNPQDPAGRTATPQRPFLERDESDGIDLVFAFPSVPPRGFSEALVRVRSQAPDGEWITLGKPVFEGRQARLRLDLKGDPSSIAQAKKLFTKEMSGRTLRVDLALRMRPGEDLQSMVDPSAQVVRYFDDLAHRKILLAGGKTLNLSTPEGRKDPAQRIHGALRIKARDPNNFFRAYPGLERVLDDGGDNVMLSLQRTDGDADEVINVPMRRESGPQGVFLVPDLSALKQKQDMFAFEQQKPFTYDLGLHYRRDVNGSWERIPFDAGPVTLTITPPGPAPAAKKTASKPAQPSTVQAASE